MAQASPKTQAELKRELEALSKQIIEIDLKIQQFRQQRNTQHIPVLEVAKLELQKSIVQKDRRKLDYNPRRPKERGGARLVSGGSRYKAIQ